MEQLRQINKQELLQELKNRVMENKISEEEIFQTLEKGGMITEYKKVDYSKLTKEDWKKACETLEKNENYQEEVKLWDNISDE